MNRFKADLHNHTILSPCGDIEMLPKFIIDNALEKGFDIIGITDHNSTLEAREIKRMVGEGEPYILCGAEITTKEEVHCLAFVDGEDNLNALQKFLDDNLPQIPNNEEIFGYQLLVGDDEEVIGEAPYLLISAIAKSVTEVEKFVHSLGGIFIPAHIDKMQNSIISQLGFLPGDLNFDALEISAKCDFEQFISKNKYILNYKPAFIRSSDAHYTEDFCRAVTFFNIVHRSFDEIKMALKGIEGRSVEI